ncbi:hypothetical protein BDQ17DRAFT_1404633 [Cyathus striatus]|nr:hypothetical protein BDQ17DRAFT_1404633 [Cyathus striatus]
MNISVLLCWLSILLPLSTLFFLLSCGVLSLGELYRAFYFLMGMLQRVFPSFTLVMTNRSESPALPDYYRSTRQEVYGPHARNQASAVFDAMRTLDARNDIYDYRCSDYLLPDISEEGGSDDDVELDSVTYSLKEEDFDFAYSPPARYIDGDIGALGYRRRKSVVIRPASRFSIDLSN